MYLSAGGLCGSRFINQRFKDHVRGVVGPQAFFKLEASEGFKKAMGTFNDVVKPSFGITQGKSESLTFERAELKDNLRKGLERDTLVLEW
jgi:predicted nucleic-acid-binding protein